MNRNPAKTASILSESERRKIDNIILDLETSHNNPSFYAQLLINAVIHIEPEGTIIAEKSDIERYKALQANKKTYSDYRILKETSLSCNLLLLTRTETLYSAHFRGMQASQTKLYNIILQKKNNSWEIFLMQIVKYLN